MLQTFVRLVLIALQIIYPMSNGTGPDVSYRFRFPIPPIPSPPSHVSVHTSFIQVYPHITRLATAHLITSICTCSQSPARSIQLHHVRIQTGPSQALGVSAIHTSFLASQADKDAVSPVQSSFQTQYSPPMPPLAHLTSHPLSSRSWVIVSECSVKSCMRRNPTVSRFSWLEAGRWAGTWWGQTWLRKVTKW